MEIEIFSSKDRKLPSDLIGSVAADCGGANNIFTWLDERKIRKDNDKVVGIQLSFLNINGQENSDLIDLTIIMTSRDEINEAKSQNLPVPVRRINLPMTFAEFQSLFQNFKLTLSPWENGTGLLEGLEFEYESNHV
jgi:hypothetical protein